MVALDFPDAPTNGEVYDKWTWNGTQWVLTPSTATSTVEVLFKELSAANQTGITTIVDITGMSATFTAVAGAVYRVTAWCLMSTSGPAGDTAALHINVNGAVMGSPTVAVLPTGGVGVTLHAITHVAGLAAGTVTVKLQASRFSGTGNITVNLAGVASFVVDRVK